MFLHSTLKIDNQYNLLFPDNQLKLGQAGIMTEVLLSLCQCKISPDERQATTYSPENYITQKFEAQS